MAGPPPPAAPPGVAAARRANGRAVGRRVNRRTTVGAIARPDVVVRDDAAPVPARIRRSNYAQEETDNLLDLLEDHLPIGQQEWIAVAAAHADRFPGKNRDYNALRRKYNKFANCKSRQVTLIAQNTSSGQRQKGSTIRSLQGWMLGQILWLTQNLVLAMTTMVMTWKRSLPFNHHEIKTLLPDHNQITIFRNH